jgi:outer membrane protein, heavy metal efflux system
LIRSAADRSLQPPDLVHSSKDATMPLIRATGVWAIVIVVMIAGGCTHRQATTRPDWIAEPSAAVVRTDVKSTVSDIVATGSDAADSIAPASLQEDGEVHVPPAPRGSLDGDDPFAGLGELPLQHFIDEVQARNPSLQAAQAAWSAAANRYPQVVALDDPMLDTMLAPASLSANSPIQSSYTIGVSQKIPGRGKRALRGEIALWEANAAAWDAQEIRLRLTLAASLAYFELYLTEREREINRANITVLKDIRSAAKSRYESNLVSAQDLSLADLELAKLEQRDLELKQMQRVATARINTLLHRRPEHPLPPTTRSLTIASEPTEVAHWQSLALQQRPELAALSSRIQSEQNAVALACKDYYPDFEVLARYDSFWTDIEQRGIIGLSMNLPVNRDKRAAAVNEAIFRLSRLHAEYAQLADSVREDVETNAARVEQAHGVAQLYEQRVLPAAEISLNDAKAAYVAGTVDFQRLLQSRRQLADEQLGYHRTLADYHRSLAQLTRAVGSPAGQTSDQLPVNSGP